MKCVLFVYARQLESNQQLSAAYCSQSARAAAILVMRNIIIKCYGKTYNGYIIYRHARCTSRACGARSGSPQIVVRVAVLHHTLWGSYGEAIANVHDVGYKCSNMGCCLCQH